MGSWGTRICIGSTRQLTSHLTPSVTEPGCWVWVRAGAALVNAISGFGIREKFGL